MEEVSDFVKLRELKERHRVSEEEMAAILDVNWESYLDLEDHPHELGMSVDLVRLERLAERFGMALVEVIEPGKGRVSGDRHFDFGKLAGVVAGYLEREGMEQGAFEEAAGWELGEFLRLPSGAGAWNFECLWDVARVCGREWWEFTRG